MRKFLVIAMLAAVIGLPLWAQDNPKAEIFGGYEYLRINPGSGAPGQNNNGWNAALTGNLSPNFGITADFAGAYKSIAGVRVSTYTFLFGPTLASRSNDKVTPFAHALLGGAHASAAGSGESAFAMALGGGIDYKAGESVAIRIGQFDYLMTRFGSSTQNNFRYSAGVVFRFGSK